MDLFFSMELLFVIIFFCLASLFPSAFFEKIPVQTFWGELTSKRWCSDISKQARLGYVHGTMDASQCWKRPQSVCCHFYPYKTSLFQQTGIIWNYSSISGSGSDRCVVNITTPANFFHVLRRQVSLLHSFATGISWIYEILNNTCFCRV